MIPELGIGDIVTYLILTALGLDRGRTFVQTMRAKSNGNNGITLTTETKRSVDRLWVRFEKSEKEINKNISDLQLDMRDRTGMVKTEVEKIGVMIENIQSNQKINQDNHVDTSGRVRVLESKIAKI